MGLGAGNDRVHAPGRLVHRRLRPSPNFLPWCLRLPDRAHCDGVFNHTLVIARRRLDSSSHWRGPRHASADCSDPTIFDDPAALDRLLDHLQCHERWLPDRRVYLRFRPSNVRRARPVRFPGISSDDLPDTFSGSPRVRVPASSDDLFFATRSGSDRRRRQVHRRAGEIHRLVVGAFLVNRPQQRYRNRGAISTVTRSVRFLPASRVSSLDRVSEVHLPFHGLRVP